jgi:ketol-acid reductoisomerase
MMRLTIIGFGNQARAWAQNLRDSGFPLRVALKPESPSIEVAIRAGFDVVELGSDAFFEDEAFALLTPDNTHNEIMTSYGHKLSENSVVLYAHGFSLLHHQFQQRFPHLRHVLFAPKSIGSELRRQYELQGKLGAVYSLEFVPGPQAELLHWLRELARQLGINMGPYATSFERETTADLYSEQGLLCSLVPYAASEMFSHLLEEGIEPELAYFECWHELKLIVNAMVDKGPEAFFDLISPNALIGSEKGYHRLFTNQFKQNLKSLLLEIKSGQFNQELEVAQTEELRRKIRERWHQSPLNKTFHQINQDHP